MVIAFWTAYLLGMAVTTYQLINNGWWAQADGNLWDLFIETSCAVVFWPCTAATWFYKYAADNWLPGEEWY